MRNQPRCATLTLPGTKKPRGTRRNARSRGAQLGRRPYFGVMVQSPSELTWTKPGVSATVPL